MINEKNWTSHLRLTQRVILKRIISLFVEMNTESQKSYQNMSTQDQDQTEFYEYTDQSNSTSSRMGNFFNSNILQKSPEIFRHAPNLLDTLPSNVNRTLLFAKLFYFWYFAAFGSLFPLMSIYFKQMGMGPSYCGILMGFR